MRSLLVLVVQVVIAILVAGALMPVVLVSIPETQLMGPWAIGGVMGLVFLLLRVLWSRARPRQE
jgi:hypothetical protein